LPLEHPATEPGKRQPAGIFDEPLLAAFHCVLDTRVGPHSSKQHHLVGSQPAGSILGGDQFEVDEHASAPVTTSRFGARQFDDMTGHDLGRCVPIVVVQPGSVDSPHQVDAECFGLTFDRFEFLEPCRRLDTVSRRQTTLAQPSQIGSDTSQRCVLVDVVL